MPKLIISFISICLALLSYSSAIGQSANQKASKILTIAQQLNWSSYSGDFQIFVLSDKGVADALENSKPAQIGGKNVVVKRLKFNLQIKPCNILFVDANSTSNSFFDGVLNKVGNKTVVITEKDGMLKAGSHINFVNKGGSVGYQLNINKLQNMGLSPPQALISGADNRDIVIVEVPVEVEKKESEEENLSRREKRERRREERQEKVEELKEDVKEKVQGALGSERIINKAAQDKQKNEQRADALKRYIAALEGKLDGDGVDYESLKKQYETELAAIEDEIDALNIIIIEKDSIMKKDREIAEKKIALAHANELLAETRANRSFWVAVLSVIIALLMIGVSILFFRDSRIIRYQKNALADQLEEINQQKEEIAAQRDEIERQRDQVAKEQEKSDELLLNILPASTAQELKEKGKATPQNYEQVSVLFTDFKGFTQTAAKLSPEALIEELNECFSAFDEIMERHNMERIKTIGDAYMAAGGLPKANDSNALDAVNAAIEIQTFMKEWQQKKLAQNQPYFACRLGIHTGKIVAGVVGKKKFAYDIWGDTVNLASRMESSGEVGEINISEATYQLVKQKFECQSRGKIQAKGKGEVEMFFVKY